MRRNPIRKKSVKICGICGCLGAVKELEFRSVEVAVGGWLLDRVMRIQQTTIVFDGILSLPYRADEISYYGFEYFQMFHSIGLVFLGNRRYWIYFLDARDSERTSCGASPASDPDRSPC
jgi:hypothetical protein